MHATLSYLFYHEYINILVCFSIDSLGDAAAAGLVRGAVGTATAVKSDLPERRALPDPFDAVTTDMGVVLLLVVILRLFFLWRKRKVQGAE